MHYFTRDFLALAADHVRSEGVYHIAKKKIPSKDGPVQVRHTPNSLKIPAAVLATCSHHRTWRCLMVYRVQQQATVHGLSSGLGF